MMKNSYPTKHIDAQSQQQNHYRHVCNMFKVNNKDNRIT